MEEKWKDVHKLPFSDWRETAMDEGLLFMEVIQELVRDHDESVTNVGLKSAAKSILAVLPIIQAFEKNEETFEQLAAHALGIIVAIWHSYDKATYSKDCLPDSFEEIIDELAGSLQILYSLVIRKAEKNKNRIKRKIFGIANAGDIKCCRRKLVSAAAKLEAEPDININSLLLEVVQEQEYRYRHVVRLGKKQVTERDANAAKREAEKMLDEERKKYAEDEWRNFTVLMHAR